MHQSIIVLIVLVSFYDIIELDLEFTRVTPFWYFTEGILRSSLNELHTQRSILQNALINEAKNIAREVRCTEYIFSVRVTSHELWYRDFFSRKVGRSWQYSLQLEYSGSGLYKLGKRFCCTAECRVLKRLFWTCCDMNSTQQSEKHKLSRLEPV